MFNQVSTMKSIKLRKKINFYNLFFDLFFIQVNQYLLTLEPAQPSKAVFNETNNLNQFKYDSFESGSMS